METLFQDVRFGGRMLLKNKGFTFVAIAALSLGIGASTAIFTLVDAVLLRPLPYPHAERIVYFEGSNPSHGISDSNVSAPDVLDWKTRSDAFEHIAILFSAAGGVLAPENGEPVRVPRAAVQWEFFPTLGVQPALGRGFGAAEDRPDAAPTALISDNLWRRHFNADRNIVGRQVTISGRPTTVVGVMPAGFNYPNGDTEVWTALRLDVAEEPRNNRSLEAIGRLKPNATMEQAQTQLTAINAQLARQFHETNDGWDVRLMPLQNRLVRGVRPSLLALLGGVFFLLLIACANVGNLLLARAAVRRREIALRAALGASRGRVWRQLLTESLLLALLGGTIGLVLSIWLAESLARFALADLPRLGAIGLNGHALLIALGVSIFTGMLFGTAPALHASKLNLTEALNEGGRSGGESAPHRTRDLFLVAQVALSLVLLVGAGLLIKSFQRLRDVQPGFNPKNVLTVAVGLPYVKYPENANRAQFFERLVENVSKLPGVESAAATLSLPLNGTNYLVGRGCVREGRPLTNAESIDTMYDVVTPGYFRTLGIAILAGRDFTPNDKPDSLKVAIINRNLAERYFGSAQASLGKHITIWPDEKFPREIVGVVADTKHITLDAPIAPQTFIPYAQEAGWDTMAVAVRTRIEPTTLTEPIRQQVLALDKGQPIYRVQTMEEVVQRSTATRRASMVILGAFAAAALLLAAIGIYGVMAYVVTQRTREIGIRMALGAQKGDVLRLIVRQGMLLAGAGAIVGLLGSLFFSRALGSLLYNVGAADPLTYAAIVALLFLVAFIACYLPARRAAKLNPVTALAQN
jgi:putative ABC transport system permease protein